MNTEERIKKYLNEAEHGFDLTDISAKNWKKLVKDFGLKKSLVKNKWEWKGKDILVVTGNDPISGKYSKKGQREDEKDYAGYIGIEGKTSIVKKVAEFIRNNGDPKDESKGSRDFI